MFFDGAITKCTVLLLDEDVELRLRADISLDNTLKLKIT